MIVDSIVLLSISSYADRVSQFVSVLLGKNDRVFESFEIEYDEGTLPIIAAEKLALARNVVPDMELIGFLFVNYGLDPHKIAAPNDTMYMVLLEMNFALSTVVATEEVQCCAFRSDPDPGTLHGSPKWTNCILKIKDDRATEAAVTTVFGDHDALTMRRSKQVLLRKIRSLRAKLNELDTVSRDQQASTEQKRNANAEMGKIIALMGQLRKIMPDLLDKQPTGDSDRVIYEMLAQVTLL